MRIDETPHDNGMHDGFTEIKYVVDKDGKYRAVRSEGWEPVNVALAQAWDVIDQDMREALEAVRSGRLSPIGYHMARMQMSLGLLAEYVRLPRRVVRRHLKLKKFARLGDEELRPYAELFEVSIDALRRGPDVSADDGAG